MLLTAVNMVGCTRGVPHSNSLLVDDLLYGAVSVIEQALRLQRAQVGDVVAGHAVMVEQVPLATELDDAVVGGPAHDGVEEHALIGERPVGVVADGVA